MKKLFAALALTVATTVSSSALAQSPTDYRTAYQQAQEGDKPLLVLVTATWCPPCQVMKRTTIPELMQKKAFKDFYYSTVDLDEEEPLARQLIGDRGVPQLIMYEKQGDKWVRRYLPGLQTASNVEAFVAQSGMLRTADASTDLLDK
jgi:thiol:disulfide interchange protein